MIAVQDRHGDGWKPGCCCVDYGEDGYDCGDEQILTTFYACYNFVGYFTWWHGYGSECWWNSPTDNICCTSGLTNLDNTTDNITEEASCPQECIDAGCECNCLSTLNGIVCL